MEVDIHTAIAAIADAQNGLQRYVAYLVADLEVTREELAAYRALLDRALTTMADADHYSMVLAAQQYRDEAAAIEASDA